MRRTGKSSNEPGFKTGKQTRSFFSGFFFGLVLLLYPSLLFGAETIALPAFDQKKTRGNDNSYWKALTFPKIKRHTRYTVIKEPGRTILKAYSDNAASGMIFEKQIDPIQYPLIAWSWKVDQVVENGDVTSRRGDDYAARLYVAFAFDNRGSGWWQGVKNKTASFFAGKALPGSALNYIWANKAEVGDIVDSPYTAQSKMIVVRSGNRQAGEWLSEQRNIAEDYQAAFGRKPPRIVGIAVMTDTDDTGAKAVAWYGPIILRIEKTKSP